MKSSLVSIFFSVCIFSLATLPFSAHSQYREAVLKSNFDSVDVVHYDIRLNITDFQNKNISGYTNVSIIALFNDVSNIPLELFKLSIDSVTGQGGQHFVYQYNDTLILIENNSTVNAGDTMIFSVYYHGKPKIEFYGWGGFHFDGSYAYNLGIAIKDIPHNYGKVWFPCVDNFTDRASYDFHILTANNHSAVCNGTLESITDHGNGTSTHHWKLEQSIPTYLASVAVADYILIEDVFHGQQGDIPTNIYVKSQDSVKAVNSFVNLIDILGVFEDNFGPYRWPRVGYVGAPKGAMEHATNITYPLSAINGTLSHEYLYAHELAHMWFGNLVTCADAGDMWLNEGWATYAEFVYKEGIYGIESRKNYQRSKLRDVLQYSHVKDNGYHALYGMPLDLTYGTTVYDKGACVVNSLQAYLGDSLFHDGVIQYLDSFASSHASSYDLMQVLTNSSGIDMTDFFDAWVFSPGFVHFALDSFNVSPSSTPGYFDVNVHIRQKLKGSITLANSNRVEIRFLDQQWNQYDALFEFSGQQGWQSFQVPFNPVSIIVDPGERLCDATTDYTRTIKSNGNLEFNDALFGMNVVNVSDSALVRITHHWVPPDPFQQPIEGLRISDYRYWSVDGIFPAGFIAKASFTYSHFGNLDGGVILNQQDTVILLYRPSAGHAWQFIDFTMDGATYSGKLIVDTLKRGEYTIAVWDHVFLYIPEIDGQGSIFDIYPNPSSSDFWIQIPTGFTGNVIISDISGKVVDSLAIPAGMNEIRWKPKSLERGVYIAVLKNTKGLPLESRKIIYNGL